MKKIAVIFAILMIGSALKGQAPSSFTYQSILMDGSGTALPNTAAAVKFEILQGSSTGPVVYTETHNVTSSASGLLSISLGTGTTTDGSISDINWNTGTYFLKITVNGTIMGTTQLLSVPYALFSSKSGNGFSGNYNDLLNRPDLTVGTFKKVTVTSETDNMEEPLFEVKNKAGKTVFAVYNEGVRISVGDGSKKGSKGGFAIGGFGNAKSTPPQDYFVVNSDVIRAYINQNPTKGSKGGFAIGGFGTAKGEDSIYLSIRPDSTNVYVRSLGKGGSSTFNILSLDNALNQKSLLSANTDTIDMNSVITIENNLNVYGNVGYTGAVDKLPVPDLTTMEPSIITETTASSGGYIVSNGGAAIIVSGIVWNTSPGPTIALTTKTTDGTTSEGWTSPITGLTANTKYYVRAYATNSTGTGYGNEIMFTTLGAGGTVADFDGNIYNTVIIGTQTWMAENLKTTSFVDGTAIANVTDDLGWSYLSTPAYAWYDNDAATYKSTYGALYNWYTVNAGNLCPAGWHVPTMNDFADLSIFLGGDMVAGGKLKEAAFDHWQSPNTGATNETGFTALPGGFRTLIGPFSQIGQIGQWWSSTLNSASDAFRTELNTNLAEMMVYPGPDQLGLSVRCIQGAGIPTVITATPSPSYISATGGGEVLFDGGAAITARGVCWSISQNPTIETASFTTDGTGTGTFVSSINALQPGTRYYVRAYATNSAGTAYGNEEPIDTMSY